MYHTIPLPARKKTLDGSEIEVAKSIAMSLMHNGVGFMAEVEHGFWSLTFADADKKTVDTIMRHMESIQ